jgi:hypothetical protein
MDLIDIVLYLHQIVCKWWFILMTITQVLVGSKRMVRSHPLHLFSLIFMFYNLVKLEFLPIRSSFFMVMNLLF